MSKRLLVLLLVMCLLLSSCAYTKEDLDLAYQRGYDEGYYDGIDVGYEEGYYDGDVDGFERGSEWATEEYYESRYFDGWEEGFDAGYEEALYDYGIEE